MQRTVPSLSQPYTQVMLVETSGHTSSSTLPTEVVGHRFLLHTVALDGVRSSLRVDAAQLGAARSLATTRYEC